MRPEIDITASGDLAVFLPGPVVDPKRPQYRGRQAPLIFPATVSGLAALIRTLQAWDETAPATGVIGPLPRAPNTDIEDWLAKGNSVTRPGVKPDLAELLKEIEDMTI